MESQKECIRPEVPPSSPVLVERTLSVKIVYNYTEQLLSLAFNEDIIASLKKKAHELFGLSCIRLEIDHKPLTSPSQLLSAPLPSVLVLGIRRKCSHSSCTNPILTSSLACKYCTKAFCAKHSVPEEHLCDSLDRCREAAAQDNSERLLSGAKTRR
ncbi:hypothetical protein NEHOM01_0132 [Nematocida homosporus]|uniref:uncharacterized protein n=1 Tax=Nematocida homosporus TaxID=1912981 RepID=UPI002220421E|nr:uncharacterized protein NEHOM01_0132 [Nematocida homosporus]KAI5184387.1 hypothetical protein NEHOM01_0132 [Nematocida homosporus]